MSRPKARLDLDEARRLALVGIVSNDWLAETLVLKGGNALRIAHGLMGRASLDLDFSIEGDFESLETVSQALFRGVRDRFDARGFVIFDEKFVPKPRTPSPDSPTWWGGYEVRFKFLSREVFEANRADLAAQHRIAGTAMSVDISKHELVGDSAHIDVDGFRCRVYSKRLIVAEKLRALVQQRPEVFPLRKRTARARDFFDIQQVATSAPEASIFGDDFPALVAEVFAAKGAPTESLDRLGEDRAFHAADWRSVLDTAGDPANLPSTEFDFYFDFVISLVERHVRAVTQKPRGA